MGRTLNRLTAREVATITAPGRHADGGNLYLLVDPAGAKRWVFLYRLNGKRREMGLGSVQAVKLSRAREMAAEARAIVAEGRDPIAARAAPPQPVHRPTFGEVAERFIAMHEREWRSPVHRRQWRQTLEQHAAGIWASPIADVDTEAVLRALRPLWHTKPETASRLRARIERILDAGRVEGLREGENPARWAGHLRMILPAPRKLARGHHAAMPWREVPAFVRDLRARHGLAPLALEFLILTAARSGEVRGMTWRELDVESALWTVPAERMKSGRVHRVPLAPRALAILEFVRPRAGKDGLVFPAPRGGPMSDMTLSAVLKRMGLGEYTVHGFRSSFRDWAGDATAHPREIIEAALAHVVGDETERAYRRGDALARRRQLAIEWEAFVCAAT
ncbi:tyrosine-type recombinase/integrase [Salinarimonas sp. NSM]|uniref:tyrosine-type recombinase/integrase n=1 Tax=Salinarimonas sp. NSM TaxID=3458003 RepID=UPI0040366ABB